MLFTVYGLRKIGWDIHGIKTGQEEMMNSCAAFLLGLVLIGVFMKKEGCKETALIYIYISFFTKNSELIGWAGNWYGFDVVSQYYKGHKFVNMWLDNQSQLLKA